MTSKSKIPLFATYGNRRALFRKYVIGILILAALVTALLYLYLQFMEDAEPSFSMLPYYLIVPLLVLWDGKSREKYFIQIEANKIIFKNSKWVKYHELQADEINFIDINITDIQISTKDLRSFDIEIGYAKHSDVQLIKQKLNDFRSNALS